MVPGLSNCEIVGSNPARAWLMSSFFCVVPSCIDKSPGDEPIPYARSPTSPTKTMQKD